MGYLQETHGDTKNYFKDLGYSGGQAQYTRTNVSSDSHTFLGVMSAKYAPQLLTLTIGKILNGSEKEDGKGGVEGSENEDSQRKTLNNKLEKLLNEIGAKDQNDIENTVDKAQTERNSNIENSEVVAQRRSFSNCTDEYYTQITSLKADLNKEGITDTEKSNIEKQITKLEEKRTKEFQKLEKEYAKLIESEDKKLQNIVFKAEEAKTIITQLKELNATSGSEKETLYDVQGEVSDMSNFNKARKAFMKNKNKETAEALKSAYEAVNNPTAKKAYEQFLKSEVAKYINK